MKLIYHENPDEAVRLKCIELEKIRKTQGQAAYWHYTREVLKSDPWFMMRVALEWGWLDDKLVGHSMIKHVADHWGEDVGILFPRGHGKTLPTSALCISAIINDPNVSILEISRTDDNAEKIGTFISDQLLGNDYLQQCFSKKHNPKDGFLPSSTAECRQWGKDGYSLPYRKPRIDPTLLCISLKSAKAGKHPDIIWIDDPTEEENNDERGWTQVEKTLDGCKFLLPAQGCFWWTGTRWHDSDPLGKAVEGKLRGKQGKFKVIQFSCYEDDNITKPPTYPYKKRWNMERETGYTHAMLEEMRAPKEEGGLGEFFDAQMRNDPAPSERADIKVKDINIYEKEKLPTVGHVRVFGIETTGGGLPIFNGFREHCEEMRLSVPLQEITNPRTHEKSDRIVAAIQPVVAAGRLYCQEWMIGDDRSRDTLGYELRRIRKAAHDDIADALHNCIAELVRGLKPSSPQEPADLYIMTDLAWSEKKRADFTVVIAVAVDHFGNYWVVDYDRFQLTSPTGIYDRLLKFYRKFEEPQSIRKMSNRKHPGAWR
jgi:hypothetical protein